MISIRFVERKVERKDYDLDFRGEGSLVIEKFRQKNFKKVGIICGIISGGGEGYFVERLIERIEKVTHERKRER